MTKEILIIRLSSIGDVIHCTPVARAIKAAWPDAKVTWLVGEVSADLIKYNPHVDECIVWSREQFEKCLRKYEFGKALHLWRELKKQLWARDFYAVLDVQGLFLTGMIAKQTNCQRRIGLSDTKELNSLFMTEIAKPLGPHITDRYLGVVTALGIPPAGNQMTLVVPEEAKQFAMRLLEGAGLISQEKLAILVPGTTWITKNWPTTFFAKTADLLAKDFKIILCGGKAELGLAEEIMAEAKAPINNFTGKTRLLEMSALLAKAAVVIAGDTGPLHMASALGTPTVAVFGPTDPVTYNPPGTHNAAVFSKQTCSFCHKRKCPRGTPSCLAGVLPEEVVQQVYTVTGTQ